MTCEETKMLAASENYSVEVYPMGECALMMGVVNEGMQVAA